MSRLTIAVGLPGSGKTYYINAKKADGLQAFDDFLARDRYSDKGLFAVLVALKSGHDCIVDEAGFCIECQRAGFLKWIARLFPGIVVEVVFFEPDRETCLKNLFGDFLAGVRTDQFARRVECCFYYAERYRVPDGDAPLPVLNHYGLSIDRDGAGRGV